MRGFRTFVGVGIDVNLTFDHFFVTNCIKGTRFGLIISFGAVVMLGAFNHLYIWIIFEQRRVRGQIPPAAGAERQQQQ